MIFKTMELQELLLVPIRNGLTKPKKVRGQGTKMVNMGEIFAHDRIRSNIEMDRVPLSQFEYENNKLRKGDLLFARQSLVLSGAGKCSIIIDGIEDMVFESHLIRVRLNQALAVPLFYYYYFISKHGRGLIGTITEQVAAAGIRGSDLIKLNVPVPPIDIQQKIVSILNFIDEKIELNNCMNRLLEQMAQAIFKQWFVDFEFPNEKGEPYKSSGEEMKWCEELGKEIPKGWAVKPVSELIEINPKRILKKGASAVYVEMKNLPSFSARVTDWTIREFKSGSKFINGDVLLARITPCLENGKTAIVDFLDPDQVGWGSTEFIVLRSKREKALGFAYFLARSEEFRSHAIRNMSGSSGRQRVPESCFDYLLTAIPPSDVIDTYGEATNPFLELMKKNGDEVRSLTRLRDTLLPKFMSGEIDVSEFEL